MSPLLAVLFIFFLFWFFTFLKVPLLLVIPFAFLSRFVTYPTRYSSQKKSSVGLSILWEIRYTLIYVALTVFRIIQNWRRKVSWVEFVGSLLSSNSDFNLELFHNHPFSTDSGYSEEITFSGCDSNGNAVLVTVQRLSIRECLVRLFVRVERNEEFVTCSSIVKTEYRITHDGFVLETKELRIELRQPMERWRITFVGWLIHTESNEHIYAQFNFMWHCLSDPFKLENTHPRVLTHYAATNGIGNLLHTVMNGSKFCDQAGQLTGTILISDVQSDLLRLHGSKLWSCRSISGYSLMAHFENGDSLCISDTILRQTIGRGWLAYNGGRLLALSNHTVSGTGYGLLVDQLHNGKICGTISFEVGEKRFSVTVKKVAEASGVFILELEMDGSLGFGFLTALLNDEPSCWNVGNEFIELASPRLYQTEKSAVVVPLRSRAAKCELLTGGKASHLAKLIEVSGLDWAVPNGVCITVNAFVDLGRNSQALDLPIEGAFSEILHLAFGTGWADRKYAVRSSAVGEDSDDASAAGQMDTVLNVSGLANIRDTVFRCYQSSFGNETSTYSTQNLSDMKVAVLVQDMVESDVSGVTFTCNPLTGNRSELVINANYGLGESVVSGTVEPDTITVTRDFYDNLTIQKIEVGSKSATGGSNGVPEAQCCLSEDQIQKLAVTSIEIEKYFGNPRDIEWAFCNNNLYILQARPISNLHSETELELIHEFDLPIRKGTDYLSTANVGEVLSGPLSPVGLSTLIPMLSKCSQIQSAQFASLHLQLFAPLSFAVDRYHVLFNMHQVFYRNPMPKLNRHVMELCMLGRPVEDQELEGDMETRLEKVSIFKPIFDILGIYKSMFRCGDQLWAETYMVETLEFPNYLVKSEDIFEKLLDFHKLFAKVTLAHLFITGKSSVFYQFIGPLLFRERLGFETFYADIAKIFSCCEDVVSASVPRALEDLVQLVQSTKDCRKFAKMTLDEALSWLNSEPTVSPVFRDFLETHGHRCIHEIDLLEPSWGENPTTVVEILQESVGRPVDSTRTKPSSQSVDEVIDSLTSELSSGKKRFLKWIIPKARKAVGDRETAKSRLIKMRKVIRTGLKLLGTSLVRERRLPDAESVFYLTFYELSLLVHQQGTGTHKRAQRRKRIRPQLMQLQMPELCKGYPPSSTPQVNLENTTTIRGTQVSLGKVEARVCVALTLADAKNIRAGDILIARSTDIAWSVYFPLLSGVATELGGLLSHGAVVAREYGLPCLVGATGACSAFASGDRVLLDAHTGTLSKVDGFWR